MNLADLLNQFDDDETTPVVPETSDPDVTDLPDVAPEEPELDDSVESEEPEAPADPEPEEPETPEEPEVPESDDVVSEYYNYLVENKILSTADDFEFDGTEESLNEALTQTYGNMKEEVLSELVNNLTPQFQQLLDYGLNGGTSIEEFSKVFSNTNYDELDLSKEHVQEQVLRNYYQKTTSYTDDKIDKFINRLRNSDDMQVEAEEAIDYLKDFDKKQQDEFVAQQKQAKAEQEQLAKERRDTIAGAIDKANYLVGKRKSTVRNFVLNPIERNGKTLTEFDRTVYNVLQNEDHLIQLADLLADYDPKKGFNFSRINTKNKSKVTSEFQNTLSSRLSSHKAKVKGTPPVQNANPGIELEKLLIY